MKLWQAARKADILVDANMSLLTCWVGLCFRKKWFVIHHGLYSKDLKGKLKNLLTRFSQNISVSQFLAKQILGKSEVIPNFLRFPIQFNTAKEKKHDVVFLGRLVSEKGLDILLGAWEILAAQEIFLRVAIVGNGTEKEYLMQWLQAKHRKEYIIYKGSLDGAALIDVLQASKAMWVPSRAQEGFGMVVLEGLAAGCTVWVSNNGALPEAVGGFGKIVTDNTAEGWAKAVLSNRPANVAKDATNYIEQFAVEQIAQRYINHFQTSIGVG